MGNKQTDGQAEVPKGRVKIVTSLTLNYFPEPIKRQSESSVLGHIRHRNIIAWKHWEERLSPGRMETIYISLEGLRQEQIEVSPTNLRN